MFVFSLLVLLIFIDGIYFVKKFCFDDVRL